MKIDLSSLKGLKMDDKLRWIVGAGFGIFGSWVLFFIIYLISGSSGLFVFPIIYTLFYIIIVLVMLPWYIWPSDNNKYR